MKLVWLSLVLSTAGEGVSNSSKSETYAQRAISSWQAKRDQKKREKEAERESRRAKRKDERKNRNRSKTKASDFVTFTDSPLTSPLPSASGDESNSNSNHLNDPRPTDSEYIPNYMSHDEDDILYTPSYAMFMAKSGADISDIPIEAGDKKAPALLASQASSTSGTSTSTKRTASSKCRMLSSQGSTTGVAKSSKTHLR